MKYVYLRALVFGLAVSGAILMATVLSVAAVTSVAKASVDSAGEINTALPPDMRTLTRWAVEVGAQAHSVEGQGSPWVGLGASYRIGETYQIGLRGFVPASRTVDNSTYAIQTYGRIRLMRGFATDLFVEPDFAANFYSFSPWPSAGLAVGALNHISPGLAIGVMGGVEVAHYVIDSVGLEDRSDLIVYPKVSLIADFTF